MTRQDGLCASDEGYGSIPPVLIRNPIGGIEQPKALAFEPVELRACCDRGVRGG
jgi:hypothetical protein